MAPHRRDLDAGDPLVMPLDDPETSPGETSPGETPSGSPQQTSRPADSPYQLPSPLDPKDDPDAGAGSESSSARRSSGNRAQLRRKLADLAENLVDLAGQGVHRALTRVDSPERLEQVWLPDDEDVENISKPLGSIAARRVPASIADAERLDLLQLAYGLLRYAQKGFADLRDVRDRYGPPAADEVPGETLAVHDPPEPPADPDATPAPGILSFGRRSGLLGHGEGSDDHPAGGPL